MEYNLVISNNFFVEFYVFLLSLSARAVWIEIKTLEDSMDV